MTLQQIQSSPSVFCNKTWEKVWGNRCCSARRFAQVWHEDFRCCCSKGSKSGSRDLIFKKKKRKRRRTHMWVTYICELQRNLVPWFFFGAWVSVWVQYCSTVHSTGGWRLEPPMAGQKHSLMTLSRQLNGHNSAAAAAMLLISHVLRTTNRSVIYVRPIPSFPPWSQKSQDEKSFKSCLSIFVEVSAVCKSKTGQTLTLASSPCKNFDYSRLYLTISI